MAGTVNETTPQKQTIKRSAEANPEPTPSPKRSPENLELKQQVQIVNIRANIEDTGSEIASKQLQDDLSAKEKNAPLSAVLSTEKEIFVSVCGAAETEVSCGKIANHTIIGDQSKAQNREAGALGDEAYPLSVASQPAHEDIAGPEGYLKKRDVLAEVLVTLSEHCSASRAKPVCQVTAEPMVKETFQTNLIVPQEKVKSMVEDMASEPLTKKDASQDAAQLIEPKTAKTISEFAPALENLVEVVPSQRDLAESRESPSSMAMPTLATRCCSSASARMIGNVPSRDFEIVKVPHQPASVLPPEAIHYLQPYS